MQRPARRRRQREGKHPSQATVHRSNGTYDGRVKYVVCVPDGAADEPLEELGGRTPLEAASLPNLRALAGREPGNRFVLLLGADAAGELSQWYEVEALPRLAEVVAFARPGVELRAHGLIGRVVTVPALDISATAVRERVAQGRSIRYLVPDPVREYIATHRLYR